MRKHRVHKIIEHILRQPQFPFDSFDVEESLEDVLAHFGVNELLFNDELAEIRRYLLPRGVAYQVAEMARVRKQGDPVRGEGLVA